MLEIRFHGRGGQGAVVATILLAKAFFRAGYYVQSFPLFGVERRGAPVEAYLRLDRDEILIRTNSYTPDHVVVLDTTLLEGIDVTRGLKPTGWILLNAPEPPGDSERFSSFRLAYVDATEIALKHGLGTRTHPIVNTAMMGALARILGAPPMDAVAGAIEEEISDKVGVNVEAAREAYEGVSGGGCRVSEKNDLERVADDGRQVSGVRRFISDFRHPTPDTRLLVPHSSRTTESNKTGAWRFLRPRYDEKTAPCSAACPAGEDIGRIEMLAAQGLFKEAWETILKENPLPAVCGRVCFRPCEKRCNRREFDDGIGIHAIERFLADTAARYELQPSIERLAPKNRKIAVVGAGPAGLAAAYFLSRLGYGCDVFESSAEPGGVLRYGIPAYRLPVAILRAEIERVARGRFNLYCGKPVTKAFLDEMQGEYDGFFLGCGRSRGVGLDIAGEGAADVEDGLQFLQKVSRGDTPSFFNGQVAVVGGGNTAVDAARTALRLGGKPLLIYRRRREDMPAFEDEISMALEEGVQLLELLAPVRIERKGGEYLLSLQQMRAIEAGPGERARIEPLNPQKTLELRVSHILKGVGLEAAEEWYNPPEAQEGVLRLADSVIVEGRPIFVHGGDLASRIKSVAHAVASGKEAAIALDILLEKGAQHVLQGLEACRVGNGSSLSMEVYMQGPHCARNRHVVAFSEINTDHFQFAPKVAQPRLLKEERAQSFAEIDLRISAGLAMKEAERCFNCGLCNQCDNCRLYCPDLAVVREGRAGGRRIDYDYCKGCGICVVECPRNAMSLEKESPPK